jgi:PAS domain S-box-containing protein
LKETGSVPDLPSREPRKNGISVPEIPFGIRESYWKAGLIVFAVLLMLTTIATLMGGAQPDIVGSLYVIPAILFAYFYRRRGVLLVYLLSMFYFAVVVLFRYPSGSDIVTAAIRSGLDIAVALIVSFLTAHLIREKRKYHAIFDNTENGVLLVSLTENRILEMNQRFASAFSLTAGSVEGLSLDTFIAEPARAPLTRLLSHLGSHCSSPATEIVMRRNDGSEWVAVVAARKIAADIAVLTFIDITERRDMEHRLQQLNEDANLSLDILTHDVNNINTASLNYGRLLLERPGMGEDELSRKLVRTLEKSDEIIRNVSTLRKLRESPAKKIRFHLADVIRKEIAGYPDTRIDYDGSDAVVIADDMLSSVFGNLIGNCIKYGGPDPRIAIRVTPREKEVVVSIEDHGHGIPDPLKPLIFERFQRGDTSVSGRGLGLFICRTLIERYGGSIRADDRVPGNPSQGAAIRFILPLE